jgi:hypothetical protein
MHYPCTSLPVKPPLLFLLCRARVFLVGCCLLIFIIVVTLGVLVIIFALSKWLVIAVTHGEDALLCILIAIVIVDEGLAIVVALGVLVVAIALSILIVVVNPGILLPSLSLAYLSFSTGFHPVWYSSLPDCPEKIF